MSLYHRVCFIYICDVFTCYCWNYKKTQTFNEIWVWSRQTANETRSADSVFQAFWPLPPGRISHQLGGRRPVQRARLAPQPLGWTPRFLFCCPQASPQQGWQILRGMKRECEHGLKSLDGGTLTPSICDAETHERGNDFGAVRSRHVVERPPTHPYTHWQWRKIYVFMHC